MRPLILHRLIFAFALTAVLAACGNGRDAPPVTAEEGRAPASEVAQRMSGLSHVPEVESPEALGRSLARHYPAEFADVRPATLVLMDVRLDEKGRVLDAVPADRPARGSENVSMVLVDHVAGSKTPVERVYKAEYDQAFGPAASAALREMRFKPALRTGQPVPYTLRMTVEFRSPVQASPAPE